MTFALQRSHTRLQLRFGLWQLGRQVVGQLGEQLVMQFQLIGPSRFVNAGNGVEFVLAECQTRPVQVFVFGA